MELEEGMLERIMRMADLDDINTGRVIAEGEPDLRVVIGEPQPSPAGIESLTHPYDTKRIDPREGHYIPEINARLNTMERLLCRDRGFLRLGHQVYDTRLKETLCDKLGPLDMISYTHNAFIGEDGSVVVEVRSSVPHTCYRFGVAGELVDALRKLIGDGKEIELEEHKEGRIVPNAYIVTRQRFSPKEMSPKEASIAALSQYASVIGAYQRLLPQMCGKDVEPFKDRTRSMLDAAHDLFE